MQQTQVDKQWKLRTQDTHSAFESSLTSDTIEIESLSLHICDRLHGQSCRNVDARAVADLIRNDIDLGDGALSWVEIKRFLGVKPWKTELEGIHRVLSDLFSDHGKQR